MEANANVAYRLGETERDVRDLNRRLSAVEVGHAESRRDQASMQRSVDALTAIVNKLMWTILGTGLTVAGALIVFALTGGGG